MRFEHLHIPAFGPFTDLDIRFPAHGGDLQVIHGPNEAGKSSLLRAFRDLLFGIHGQSRDNFIHAYKHLRIGATVRNQAGETLSFQRRKGNRNTLLDAGNQPLPDDALTPFLGSVDAAYFSTMFGLGAAELREGAEQLLRGEGRMGDTLFSASMGGTPVQQVMAALTEESERLFKGRATASVSIRPAVDQYKDLLRKSREAAVNPEAWEKIERDMAASEKNLAELDAAILEIDRRLQWISRCEDALPLVGRLAEETRNLEALPPMPEVSSDFVERARAARRDVNDTGAEVRRLNAHIASLEKALPGLRPSTAILSVSDVLTVLHQGLGVYQERKHSLSDIEIEMAGLEAALKSGMQHLGLKGSVSHLESLRLGSAERLAFEEAAEALTKAKEQLEKHQEKTEDLETQTNARSLELDALPETDLTPLRDALSAAAGATDASTTLSAVQSEMRRLEKETLDLHRGLTGAPADMDETAALPVPAKSTIRRAGDEMDDTRRQIKLEEIKLRDGKKRIASIEAELVRIERRGELPSEQALIEARAHRDRGWDLVLADWKGEGAQEELVTGIPLEEAFAQAISRADVISDQLREQAEAVAQVEEKRFQIGKSEKENQEAEAAIRALDERVKASRSTWEAAWHPCGITPLTPAEMDEWRDNWLVFKGALRQLKSTQESFDHKNAQVKHATKVLAAVLGDTEGKGFERLFETARQKVQQEEESRGRRKEIAARLKDLDHQLEALKRNSRQVEEASAAALETWQARCRAAGLPEAVSPAAGLALLKERTELLATCDRWLELSAESLKKKAAVGQYEQSVKDRCEALGIEGDTTEARVSRLWDALTRNRDARTRFDQLSGQIETARVELLAIEASAEQALRTLKELMALAKLETVEDLEPLLAGLEAKNAAKKQIAVYRDTLSGLARGLTVEAFVDRIKAEDTETLPQRKTLLENRKKEKEAERQLLRETLHELKNEKRTLMAAGDTAAAHRQEAEFYGALLKQDASRYVRLRLAIHFLKTQIERFRRENQGPLLEKSSRIFQDITRGTFHGLGAEFNADDTPVLVGLRPDRTRVSISGMSDGTRDQLFLALRLAALDRYLEQHEPMPLILDDILITWDDERAMAILPQFAELARRTQIFLFTHHDHLVDLCRRRLGEGGFHLHRLDAGGIASDHR